MSNRRKRQNELYWKQKELRNVSMLKGNFQQVNKMREKQDNAYKMFKFYEGLNNAIEKERKKDNASGIGKEM